MTTPRLRLVQRGSGAVALGFLIGNGFDAKLRLALPGVAIVATDDKGLAASKADVAAAVALAGLPPGSPVLLFGYSAGCQGVRAILASGFDPLGVACFDGTHSSMPVAAAHVAIWQKQAQRARRGEALFVATTLAAHDYVEGIPDGQKGRAASTARVLSLVVGVELQEAPSRAQSGFNHATGRATGPDAVGAISQVVHDRDLHVLAYRSSNIDHKEHAYQGSHVMPEVLAEFAAPFLAARLASPTPTATPPEPRGVGDVVDAFPWDDDLELETRPLALRICAWLGRQVGLDIREIPGPQHNPLIVAFGKACRRGGTFLGVNLARLPQWLGVPGPVGAETDEEAWCAKARSAALLACLLPGETPPHGLRVSVRELVEDARKARTLRLAGTGYVPHAGDAAILKRAGGNPLLGGSGHVRTVISVEGDRYLGIGGNEANTFGTARHPLAEADLVAWIET